MSNNGRNRRGGRTNRSKADTATCPAAGGVFSRLKIPCPEFLTGCGQPDWKRYCYGSTTVPISFRSLPKYVDYICSEMSLMKTYCDSDSDYEDELSPTKTNNKAVLIKGALLLAEAKVYFSGGKYKCPQLEKIKYSSEELAEFSEMARNIPRPLVVYLECIGVAYVGRQEVTPVLAGAGDGDATAPALAPCQLAPLLARLRGGVRAGGPGDARAALRALPLRWEEDGDMLRLAEDCFDFWVRDAGPGADPRYTLRWNNKDRGLFRKIIDSVWYCKGAKDFLGSTKLSHGKGSPAQFVQTPDWKEFGSYNWFTMTAVDEESIGKGAAFGFGGCDPQPSRFSGTIETSYQSGAASFYRGLEKEMQWNKISTDIQFGTIIPVTFSSLPSLIKNSWLKASWSFQSSDEEAMFIKHGLILAEAKVYFAQQTASKKTMLHPDQLVLYSWERVSALKHMPKLVPAPLAVYLECLGNTSAEGQEVTPVLAGAGDGDATAPALAPCQLAPLLARLRGGVRAGGPGDARAALRALPLRWEEDGDMLRLAEDCFDFWVRDAGPGADPRYTLRWNDEDSRRFETFIRSTRFRLDKNCLYTELTHGKGSPAQFVQCNTDSMPFEFECFALTEIDEASFSLGEAFRFGDHADRSLRFTGPLETAYIRGYQRTDEFIDKLWEHLQ